MQTRWMTLLLLCVLLPAPATAEPETQESRSAAIRAPLPPPDSHRAPSRGVVLTDAGLLEVAPTPIAPAPLGPKQIATLEAVGDVGDGRTEYFASTGHYYDEPPDMYMDTEFLGVYYVGSLWYNNTQELLQLTELSVPCCGGDAYVGEWMVWENVDAMPGFPPTFSGTFPRPYECQGYAYIDVSDRNIVLNPGEHFAIAFHVNRFGGVGRINDYTFDTYYTTVPEYWLTYPPSDGTLLQQMRLVTWDPHRACCFGDTLCLPLTPGECSWAGGVSHPEWLTCGPPNPCDRTHVCCCGDTCYEEVLEGECEALGGVFHPEWDSCFPNPCWHAGECADYAGTAEISGSVDTPGYAYGVAVQEDLVYLADYGGGLQVIDVADPRSPGIVGHVGLPYNAMAVAISGAYAYVADETGGLQVVDVSNPQNPRLVGSAHTSSAKGVAIAGGYAYVADTYDGLVVIDVSSPASPQVVGSVGLESRGMAVAVSGSHAYVAVYGSGLQVIDISNPQDPFSVGSVVTPGPAYGVAISGPCACVADYTSMQVIDVTHPEDPWIAGGVSLPDCAFAVAVAGDFAYVAGRYAGLHVVSIENPQSPQLIGSLDTPGRAAGVAVSWPYVYVGDYDCGLQILPAQCPTMLPGEIGLDPIPLEGGSSVEGDLFRYANDYDPGSAGCTGRSAEGNDIVYSINGDPGATIAVTCVQPEGDASVYLVTDYSDLGTCVAGADLAGVGEPETFECVLPSARATYYLIVDGHGAGGGPFSLTYSYDSSSITGPFGVSGPLLWAPNPYRCGEAIRFLSSGNAGQAELRIYDVHGRLVFALSEAAIDPARGEIRWDGRTTSGEPAPAGVYYLRGSVGTARVSQKLMLVR